MIAKSLVLGRNQATGHDVYLTSEARKLSLYVIGLAGYGKTTLLEHLAHQDMENAEGLCFIDPHGDAVDKLVQCVPPHREQDVTFWKASDIDRPFGLNPFACHSTDPIVMSSRVQSFVSALESLEEFREVFAQGTRMKDLLHSLGWAFVSNPGYSLLDTLDFLDSEKEGTDYRRRFYDKLSQINPRIWKYWQSFENLKPYEKRDRVESSLNKLRRFSTDPIMQGIFGQSDNTLDFRKVMDEGKILILNLSGVGSYDAAFIGAFVVWEIWQAALSRYAIPEAERRPFHLYADEFHAYMTSAFPSMQTQARKFGLDTIVAHQTRDQIEEVQTKSSTLAVGNKVVFRVNGKDAQELSREFKAEASEEQVVEQPKRAIPVNVLEHLDKHPHSNLNAQKAYIELRDRLDEYFDYHINGVLNPKLLYVVPRGVEPPSSSALREYLLSQRRQMEQIINKWLYQCMIDTKFNPIRIINSEIIDPDFIKLIYNVQITLWKVQIPALYKMTEEELWSHMMDDPEGRQDVSNVDEYLRRCCAGLGMYLKADPCHVTTGQYETVIKRVRIVSDVQNETANTLSHLERFIARCSLLEGNSPVECTVEIKQALIPDSDGVARAQRIRAHSRSLGSTREAIITAIRQRMDSDTMKTQERSYLERSLPDSDKTLPQQSKDYNDEGPI